MIHLDRKAIKRPKVFASTELLRARAEAQKFYSIPLLERRQQTFVWDHLDILLAEVRPALHHLSHGKCAYCEQQLSLHAPDFHIDFFRPRSGAIGIDGSLSSDHYWGLAF